MADMDVDCDGVEVSWATSFHFALPSNFLSLQDKCKVCLGYGQKETSFGKLDAYKVPWYVLPLKFTDEQKQIKPNALGAIICDGKMFSSVAATRPRSLVKHRGLWLKHVSQMMA